MLCHGVPVLAKFRSALIVGIEWLAERHLDPETRIKPRLVGGEGGI